MTYGRSASIDTKMSSLHNRKVIKTTTDQSEFWDTHRSVEKIGVVPVLDGEGRRKKA